MLVEESDEGAKVKLLDFGVAKNLSHQGADMTTVSGALLGTPAYMAPEQIRHSAHVDARTDVYAIGVMLYEALTGQRPFAGNAIELLSKQLFETVVPPSEVAKQKGIARPRIDWPLMDQIVLRALAKEPEGRYPDVGDFLRELQNAWPRVALPDLSGRHHAGSMASSGNSIPEEAQLPLPLLSVRGKLLIAGGIVAASLLVLSMLLLRSPKATTVITPPPKPVATTAATPEQLATRRIATALSGSREERRALALAIADVGGSTLHDELVKLLRDPEPAVGKAALTAAAAFGVAMDPAMSSALQRLGEQAGGAVGVESMTIRLKLGDTSVLALLQAAVRAPALDVETRLRAQLVLSSARALRPAELRTAVLQAVEHGSLRPTLYRQALLELLRVKDPATVKRLDKALSDANPRLRSEAAEVLALAGRKDGQDALLALAEQNPDELSYRLLLAESGDARATALLIPKLKDPSGMVRQKAVGALGALAVHGGRPCDVSSVVPLLQDADAQVSLTAAVAFVQTAHCQSAEKTPAP